MRRKRMTIRIEDHGARVLELRPRRRDADADGPAPQVVRGPGRDEAKVIDLARVRRRPALHSLDLDPQGGDAA